MYHVVMREKDLGISPAALEEALRRADMTAADLARASGVSPATLSLILSGKHKSISSVNLAKMASVLAVSIDYLMGFTQEPEPRPLMLGELVLELTQIANSLPTRRQRDLLLMARTYLDDSERVAADPDRLFDDLIELFELYGSKTDVKRLLNLIEYKLLGGSTTPLLGDNTEQEGESDD